MGLKKFRGGYDKAVVKTGKDTRKPTFYCSWCKKYRYVECKCDGAVKEKEKKV